MELLAGCPGAEVYSILEEGSLVPAELDRPLPYEAEIVDGGDEKTVVFVPFEHVKRDYSHFCKYYTLQLVVRAI